MRARFGVFAVLALMLVMPVSVSAAPSAQIYHGMFGPTAVMYDCQTGVEDPATMDLTMPAWGNWNVTLAGDRAEVHATVFADMGYGAMHVNSFGGVAMGPSALIAPEAGQTLHVRVPVDRLGGNQIDFVLAGDTFSFTITPYFDCASATTWGTLR